MADNRKPVTAKESGNNCCGSKKSDGKSSGCDTKKCGKSSSQVKSKKSETESK